MSRVLHTMPVTEEVREAVETWLQQSITTTPGRAPTYEELKVVLADFADSPLVKLSANRGFGEEVTNEKQEQAWIVGGQDRC